MEHKELVVCQGLHEYLLITSPYQCSELPGKHCGIAAGNDYVRVVLKTVTPDRLLPAVDFLVDALRTSSPDELIVVPTGASTNIAAALEAAPDTVGRARIVMMGGSLTQPGNVTPFAEANIMQDPEASASILRTFSEETRKSIEALKEALDLKDRDKASRLSHKLIPLFTMLGANTLVQHLRILEKNDEELTDSGWNRLLEEVIEQAIAIVKDAEATLGGKS